MANTRLRDAAVSGPRDPAVGVARSGSSSSPSCHLSVLATIGDPDGNESGRTGGSHAQLSDIRRLDRPGSLPNVVTTDR
jgi:hypothetical protein